MRYYRIIIYLILSIPFLAVAQTTKIMGKVIDIKTQEPIPFVTIVIKGAQIGTTTDFNGEYSIQARAPGDSLLATCLGYNRVSKKIVKNKFQIIDFELTSTSRTLQEIVVKPGKNPAEVLLRKVIDNKQLNNKNQLDYYHYEVYTKIEFDVNNINDKMERMRLLKPFKFIFDYVDTSAVNGKSYLPIFISEALSEFYYRKSPKSEKEIIKASRNSGINNKSISQFMGNMYLSINPYDDFLNLFDKNFISPVANFGLGFYKYYLLDSAYIDNKWCYKVMFKPRRKQELTFTGNMWINDTTYAIKKIDLRIAEDANINFVNDLVCSQEYEFIENKIWMLTKESFTADFNIIENSKRTLGFYGTKTTSYRNFELNKPREEKFYSAPENIKILNDSQDKPESFWIANRHDSLDRKERGIYKMVDSIKNVPIFRTYVDIIYTITTGYYEHGDLEWGPYFKTYSYNEIEGHRFRVGARTSNNFSTVIMPEAYIAYGTLDNKFKYGGGFLYMFSKVPRRDIGIYYKNDMEQLGQSQHAFYEDNIVASVFRRNPFDKLSMVEEYKGFYEHEWFSGFSNTINFIRREVSAPANAEFRFKTDAGDNNFKQRNTLLTSELRLDLRLAYKEKYVMGEFERISMGTYFPVLNFSYGFGIKDMWGGDYSYRKVIFGLEQWFNVRSWGYSKYILEAGKVWNRLPYPLLKLLPGNETLSFDEYAFNMMNYYEFVTDEYFSFYYTHHFDGFFLNHIPVMRKLKWREVVWFKGVVGRLSESNLQYNNLEKMRTEQGLYVNSLTKPYYEAGIGVENIFKFLRVDALWRLSYLNDEKNHPNVKKFGIMATLQIML